MQASVLRLLPAALALLAGCVGRVDGNETFLEPTPRDGSRPDDRDPLDGGRPDARREAGASRWEGGRCEKQPLARGVRVREVALYQTVKVTLFDEQGMVDEALRSAPVVQGKQALVRVLAERTEGYRPRELRAVLRLRSGTRTEDLFELFHDRVLEQDSSDAEMGSTFNFEVPGEKIGSNTELSVALEEMKCSEEVGDPAETRVPIDDFAPLHAVQVAPLKVVVVPVLLNGRVPVLDETEKANIRSTLLAYYPVPDVVVEVHEQIEWTAPVLARDNKGWLDLLNQIVRERQRDHVTRDKYYMGLVQPGASWRSFCQSGCILGLAPQTARRMDSLQVALGAFFPGEQGSGTSYEETMAHELGHAHGRGHSPCNEGGVITGPDTNYPVEDGSTESWGWDSRKNQLMEPGLHKDIMGYCTPNWISTYNYRALAERSLEVNGEPLVRGAQPVIGWENLLLYADGTARWGGVSEVTMPMGDSEPATVLDASGSVIERLDVVRVRMSHTEDEMLYIPHPDARWAKVKLHDREITLSTVGSAR